MATAAYDAGNGHRVWVDRYSAGGGEDDGTAVAVSPSGDAIYVTGYSYARQSDNDYLTIAYDAATGDQQWLARYNGTGNWTDNALALAVSPRGATVFVTGEASTSSAGNNSTDYATVAYGSATGAERWVALYDGPGRWSDAAHSITTSPDGSAVYATGTSAHDVNCITCYDYATVAYSADEGAQLWIARYNGPADDYDDASSIAAAPDGSKVVVTGVSSGLGGDAEYGTVAYEARTGQELWVERYAGPAAGGSWANQVVVSPSSNVVFVTGGSLHRNQRHSDCATLAYDAANGSTIQIDRYSRKHDCTAWAIAVAPDGTHVYVAGGLTGVLRQSSITLAYPAPPPI
jgi:hypothetical protein